MPQQFDALTQDARTDTSGGLRTAAELLAGSVFAEGRANGVPRVYLALEFCQWSQGRELVITGAVQADNGGPSRIAQFLPLIESIALQTGTAAIRVHTARAGMVRQLERAGYRLQPERVLRKSLQ